MTTSVLLYRIAALTFVGGLLAVFVVCVYEFIIVPDDPTTEDDDL